MRILYRIGQWRQQGTRLIFVRMGETYSRMEAHDFVSHCPGHSVLEEIENEELDYVNQLIKEAAREA